MYYLYYHTVSLAKYSRHIIAEWLLFGKMTAGSE